MAVIKVSYSEAQEYVRKYLKLPVGFEVQIERKDAQERRKQRSSGPAPSQMADSNIQR